MQRIMKDFPVRELDPKFFNDKKNKNVKKDNKSKKEKAKKTVINNFEKLQWYLFSYKLI